MAKQERCLSELYGDDPERGDALAFGRRTGASRRGFLGGAGLAAMGAAVGGTIPFSDTMPGGLIPAAMAQSAPPAPPAPSAGPAAAAPKGPQLLDFPGKAKGLVLLGDRPLVAETPEHMLDDDTTPFEKFYVRNNGQTPEPFTEGDAWELTIDGEVNTPLKIKLGELKQKFTHKTFRMVLECGGNGRSFFQPQARGNQWTNGGAGCAEWTGVPLAEVLNAVKVKSSAKYTAHAGADPHLSGDPKKQSLSRGMPVQKAMEEHTLLVFAMNGEPLPNVHGGPLRLVVPGWPASLSHKWLTRITLRDKEHDGQGMTGHSYRLPSKPLIPGSKGDGVAFDILESMPVRAVVTSPANGSRMPAGGRSVTLRGAAWGGDVAVGRVDVTIDGGQTWIAAKLQPVKNRYDWNRWSAEVKLPADGYYEIFARATDANGKAQPTLATNWNPQGYGGNAQHRIAILVG